jgi:hypothetical protein
MESNEVELTIEAMRFDLSRAHERLQKLETHGYVILLAVALAVLYWLAERKVI